ncbi:MAG TPA: LytR C-terminal domain-containing protein [Pseudonocardiaceae bacterium]|jgi:hypothetical protein|nr:LytR C-terminal domain-containing protein [Pseudonocardiaceae bacterium]
MSTPNKPGSRRKRTAGVALIALAVMAATIGVVLALTRGGQLKATGPSTSISAQPLPPPRPTAIPFPPPVISTTAQTPVVIPPAVPEPAPAEAAPLEQAVPANGKGASRGEVRIYNNSTIRGLAARAARDLSAAGWTVVEVGNYPWGIIPTTTVYYQEDTDQRAGAEAIASEFGMRAEPRFPGIANASPGLIVIVTNDYRT